MATGKFTVWQKATKSGDANGCFEICFDVPGVVAVRDSKLGGASPVLEFTDHEFACFKDGILKGEFERA
ncbi:DUF397 domain-containing protein [Catelliglobosispora koreensis]|uniref:DUF397 domain-containing protein n=1 Tax=Catelliglobosispora koreensis TaxID=129052 RepID=UPI00035E5924|nr:DUF397 domain-containing protein [Catelliglobosispora koreensis]